MSYLYYLLGYETEIEADERQKHLKHLAMKQIKQSNIKLKNCCGVVHTGECVYIGTIEERKEAYKKAQSEELPLEKPKLVRTKKAKRKKPRYVDACNPETSDHPYAHQM